MIIHCCAIRLTLTILLLLASLTTIQAQSPLVEFTAVGKLQQGLRLVEFSNETVIIGRDGWLHSLQADPSIRVVEGQYEPLPATQLRNELRAEFGRDFEVVATQHFLVVQPVARGKLWPDLFEQSHRAFLSFMSRRGVNVRNGRFPMVAIVFPDEKAMYDEFRRLKIDKSRVAGIYANASNRVMTHDNGRRDWTAATVRHEAAHQSAFNTGVHSRINDTPQWITEGIGQLFEPVAMTDLRLAAPAAELVNVESMQLLKTKFALHDGNSLADSMKQLISDDTMFKDDQQIETAYAISWAMMFYLAHRQTDAFANVLNHTVNRQPFEAYTRDQKMKDFLRIVGCDTHEFSKRVTRYLLSL